MQQACYLGGGPLIWIFPLYLHVNLKSDDDDVNFQGVILNFCDFIQVFVFTTNHHLNRRKRGPQRMDSILIGAIQPSYGEKTILYYI